MSVELRNLDSARRNPAPACWAPRKLQFTLEKPPGVAIRWVGLPNRVRAKFDTCRALPGRPKRRHGRRRPAAEAVWPLYAIVVFSVGSKEQGRKRWKSRHRNLRVGERVAERLRRMRVCRRLKSQSSPAAAAMCRSRRKRKSRGANREGTDRQGSGPGAPRCAAMTTPG